MVSITEQYVFAKPFSRDDPTNRNDPLLDEEAERLRSDARCCQRAEHMKKLFLENCDCFCHGDLHTGSVMIKDGQPKVSLEQVILSDSTHPVSSVENGYKLMKEETIVFF